MPKFSKNSIHRLKQCHPLLQLLFLEIIKSYDCIILTGYRDEEAQMEAYRKGYSKVRWPRGRHNQFPSLAVDAAPWPLQYDKWKKDPKDLYFFAGYVMGTAKSMCIPIRSGVDWDRDFEFDDQRFIDAFHFEIQLDQLPND